MGQNRTDSREWKKIYESPTKKKKTNKYIEPPKRYVLKNSTTPSPKKKTRKKHVYVYKPYIYIYNMEQKKNMMDTRQP